ncbi:hypothetical protein F2P45_19950 [Massilia sp. CCM 8733]|uniref:DUF1640 domain-containing protein n=2 Tax=Massilia mucilaginosa TaxID=2609282 RepID=A0ABX0NX47_9BURK|nr:hypothetical protein [Massilia mucilaginosa]NHZ91271.1 hypothetical protein [Massilia mucilaginosa]
MTDLTRQEIDAKLVAGEAKVDARLANFDTSIKTGFADLRAEFADLRAEFVELRGEMARHRAEVRAEMEKMRAEMHKGMTDIVKWVIAVNLASVGALFTVSKMTEKPPSPALVQPAPIIITIPMPQLAAPPAAPAPPN